MTEALFTLGPAAKHVLEREGSDEIRLEKNPPKQLLHFSGINDLRIALELNHSLLYFFAYWELRGLGWRQPVIPDALFAVENRTFAVEFDRGFEGLKYFVRTKIPSYERGFAGLSLSGLIIICDRRARTASLRRILATRKVPILFCTLARTRQDTLSTVDFQLHTAPPNQDLIPALLSDSLLDKSPLASQVPDVSSPADEWLLALKEG